MIAIMSPEKVPSTLNEEIREGLNSGRKVEEEEKEEEEKARRKRQPDINVPPALGENSRRQWCW